MPLGRSEIVRRAHDAMSRGDAEAFVRDMHPEVVGASHVMASEGTMYRGHDGMRRFVEELRAVFPDFRSQVVQISEYEDGLVVELLFKGRASGSGLEVEQRAWQAVAFREGRAIWFHGYASEAEALAAVQTREWMRSPPTAPAMDEGPAGAGPSESG